MKNVKDALRDAIAVEAMRQNQDAVALAERCDDYPNADHIDDYLTGKTPMQSNKVAELLRALGMKIIGRTFDPFEGVTR